MNPTTDSDADLHDFEQILGDRMTLEPADFEFAKQISDRQIEEAMQWQTYSNVLALRGFEHWLAYQGDDIEFDQSRCSLWQSINQPLSAICNLIIGSFRLCLLINTALVPDAVIVPRVVVESSELAAHLYVGLEVLENQVIWRGFLQADQLVHRVPTNNTDDFQLPFACFEASSAKLCYLLRLLKPSDLALKLASEYSITPLWIHQGFGAGWRTWQPNFASVGVRVSKAKDYQPIEPTALIELIEGTQNDETLWSAIEQLWQIAPEHPAAGVKRVKTLTLKTFREELQLEFLVAVVCRARQRVHILLRIYPDAHQAYLPDGLKVSLLDEHQVSLKEIAAREQDLFIQLMLSGQSGEHFGVKFSYQATEEIEAFIV